MVSADIQDALRTANQAFEAGARTTRDDNAQKLEAIQKRLAVLFLGANEALLLLHDGYAGEATLRLQKALDEVRS